MLSRHLLILLMPLILLACQPKETSVTEAPKAVLVEEIAANTDADHVCPPSTTLKDGQCLCGDASMGAADAANWLCVDDSWMCFSVGGCAHNRGVCGFGGELFDGDCACVDRVWDEKRLGDYLCRNGYWICDKKAGCGGGEGACAYGETCFKDVADCFGVELSEDLANYRCEDKRWTCRHSEGCVCGEGQISAGSHCIEGQAYCGDSPKPTTGNYKCVGTCSPERTKSVYQWLCRDIEGCPCADKVCGLGGSCHDGKCTCGDDVAPKVIEQYRCYLERNVGVDNDEISSLSYWICHRNEGCRCGAHLCSMGESCTSAQKCEPRDAKRPIYDIDFEYERGEWTCRKPDGCRCGGTLCGNGQFCDDEQCACDGDVDCAQSVCSDGRCREALSCGAVAAPGHPGYLCEDEAWICRDEAGCFCGDKPCSRGAECRQGQCVCDTPDTASPKHIESYVCDGAQWICNDKNGCICGTNVAPHGSICSDGVAYCGDKPVKDGSGYACKTIDGHGELLCLAASAEGCVCGEGFCSSGTLCINGQCLCGDVVTPSAVNTNGYICDFGNYICGKTPCQCGENGCGLRGRCENGQCVCGPNSTLAPKDASAYRCAHYQGNERHHVEEWICQGDKACRCGDTYCGSGGVCEGDKACRCGEQLAPSINPENFVCDPFYGVWACNNEAGCPFLDGRCAKGDLLGDNACVPPPKRNNDNQSSDEAQCPDGQCDAPNDCLGDTRPPKGQYICSDQTGSGPGDAQRSGWTCTESGGCPCGDEAGADICRSRCVRSDKDGKCLEEQWFAQYLPICDGPNGIGNDSTCVDACTRYCNGFYEPNSPGYACDNRAWICADDACVCGLSRCPKGHYCIGDTHCTR